MAVLLSGKPVAEHMCRDIRLRCEKLSRRGVTPTLGIVRVGRREEDIAYERGAIRRAESLNIAVRRFLLPADASQQELIQTLRTVNEDSSIHGCLLFRPLPPHLDTEAVTSVLAPEKDIDAITTASMGGLLTKSDIGFPPCTATACLELLHYYDIPLKGKKIAMIGKSATVGLPTALLLMKEEATVSVCHIFTDKEDTRSFCQDADIIISAAGCLDLIRADYVRPGQVVVDVGVNIGPDGAMHGDVAFDEVEPIVAPDPSFGWLMTIIYPVSHPDGTMAGYIMCDISMQDVVTQQRAFLIRAGGLLGALTLVCMALYLLFIRRVVILPVRQLTGAAQAYSTGADMSAFSKLTFRNRDELRTLADAFRMMLAELKLQSQEQTELAVQEERAEAELKLAAQINAAMLPKELPRSGAGPDFLIRGRVDRQRALSWSCT